MATTNILILIYFIAVAIFGVIETTLQKKFNKQKSQRPDAGLLLILLPFYAVLYLPPLEYIFIKPVTSSICIIFGFLLFIIGFIIRVKGLLALKQNFSMAVECKDKNFLVTTGIYKYVRHPLYLAVILIAASGCIIFSSIFCWLFFIIMLYGIHLRIEKEETFLLNEFQEYTDYCKRSKKLIPFLF